jgi:hypothetical protein
MPKIVNYLHLLPPTRSFDDVELSRLQAVYDRAREILMIDTADPRRERLALLVFSLSDQATDPDTLADRVVELFRNPGP